MTFEDFKSKVSAAVEKLKHEWKTFSLALVTTAVGVHDTLVAQGYDLSVWIKEDYRAYIIPAIGMLFLLLRRWTPQD